MRTFVMGDIHGAYLALKQALELCGFNYKEDRLIQLGDVCDGWYWAKECIDELMKIKHRVDILGNHDKWLLDYLMTGNAPHIWTSQGGNGTVDNFKNTTMEQRDKYAKFLRQAQIHWVDDNNRLYVHGGINPYTKANNNTVTYRLWDRELIHCAVTEAKDGEKYAEHYEEVFVGHTTTRKFNADYLPVHAGNVWDLDTGAGGWRGKLTIMNVDTKEYWQTQRIEEFYPNETNYRVADWKKARIRQKGW